MTAHRSASTVEPRARRREVDVRLTVGQIESLIALVCYADAGAPADVGMQSTQYSRLDRAADRLQAALSAGKGGVASG